MPKINRMFTSYSPRLRFVDGDDTNAGGTPPATPPVEPDFPADKPVAEMTDKEQAAYWKHHSRKHEANATKRADYDALKVKADKADALEAENATENQKALLAARAEGKSEGAQTFLADAVRGELRAQTGKTVEELAGALDLIDVTKLTLEDGTLDLPKITAFAQTLGMKAPAEENVPPTNPGKDALDRISNIAPAGTGSISEQTKARTAQLSPQITK
jgi:hypothetical protein